MRSVRPEPRFRARWAALIAIAAGLAGWLAFPRFGIWPLAILSVAGLSIAVDGRRARTGAWLGLLYGLGFFCPLLQWTGVYVGAGPWLILAAAEACFCAGLGALLPVLQRLPVGPLWVGAAWVLQEALRDRVPFGGFPWGRLAFSQASSPLRWFAALGGAPLVTFAVALAGALLCRGVLAGRRWRWTAALTAGAVAVPLLGAALSLPLHVGDTGGRSVTVALVQGSLPDLGLQFESRARQVLDDHVAETMKLAAQIRAGTVPRPDLVLWPENSSDVDPLTDPIANAEITKAVRAVGVPVLVGAILPGPGADHRRNVGIMWSPTTGPGQMYTKRHPVPWGEYIPLRSLSELVSPYAKDVVDMVAGRGNGLLTGGPVPIGDVICFEVAYDGLVHSSVAAGAQLLVVQTNNATFGHTAETYQQLAMSRLRAVENGRTVLQVATTGKSAIIDPNGGTVAESGALFTPALLVAHVQARTTMTPAARVGAVPEYVLAALAVVALGWAVARSRTRRPQPTPDPSPALEEMVNAHE